MNYDEMLEVWRAQDETPPYRVNPDLLRAVVQQEQAGLRRQFGVSGASVLPWAIWGIAGAMMALAVAVLFAATRGWATASVWDYLAMGIAIGAMLLWPGAYWASQKGQPPRERGFGNSLQEEIQGNLAWVEYQLSQYGRLAPWLLRSAPVWVVAILFFWVFSRINDRPSGWIIFFIVAWPMFLPMFSTGHYFKTQLLAYRRRLSELLELLNASEWKESEWPTVT